MTNFFIWRSCNITATGADLAIQRAADVGNRAVAILTDDSGLPPDPTLTAVGPTLDIVSASWCQVLPGNGLLAPGSYNYKLIPINTCTGITGEPYTLPALNITTPGQVGTLCVEFNTPPDSCTAVLIQQDEKYIGGALPISLRDNVQSISPIPVDGLFINGTKTTFDRASGADLIVGDLVQYQGVSVTVKSVAGSTITIDPPISLPPTSYPPWYFDIGARTNVFLTVGSDIVLCFGIPIIVTPVNGFLIPVVLPGLLAVPQVGDVINFGAKTAIVIGLSSRGLFPGSPIPEPGFPLLVAVLPLGLTILNAPAGLVQLIYRSTFSLGPYFLPTYVDRNVWSGIASYNKNDIVEYPASSGTHYVALLPSTGVQPDIVIPTPAWATHVTQVTVIGDPTSTPVGKPLDNTIQMGLVGQFSTQSRISAVEPGKDINGNPDTSSARVTLEPGILVSTSMTSGIYFILPQEFSSFIHKPTIAPTGPYKRLSRVFATTTQDKVWQYQETGANQVRSGTLSTTDASTARSTLDQMIVRGGKLGGLDAFLGKVRGPSTTSTNQSFNQYRGTLVKPTGSDRFFAVNGTALLGTSIVDVSSIRALFANIQDNTILSQIGASTTGVSVLRYKSVGVSTAIACPPGTLTTGTAQSFQGLATAQIPLQAGETCLVFWQEGIRFNSNAKSLLLEVGLTSDEAASALALSTVGRVTEVTELPVQTIFDVQDLATIPSFPEVVADTRIQTIAVGPLNSNQVSGVISQRGHAGIVRRPIGTAPGNPLVDDYTSMATNLTADLLASPASFPTCSFDSALASISDDNTRNAVAAVLATVDASLSQIEKVALTMKSTLSDGPLQAANSTVAGIVSGIAVDPTLGCLLGPSAQTGGIGFSALQGIPALQDVFSGLAFSMQLKGGNILMVNLMLNSLVCTILDRIFSLLPGGTSSAPAQVASQLVGCLGDLPPVGADFSLSIPIELNVTIQCLAERLSTITQLLNASIAEINESIGLLSNIGNGQVFQGIDTASKQCSSDSFTRTVFDGARSALGL